MHDSIDNALFCIRKEHVLTRELSNFWSWEGGGTRGTFREAFYSWYSRTCMNSARYHRIQRETSFVRQRGHEAFLIFLVTLLFSNDDDAFHFFTCSECESRLGNDKKRIEDILMYGSPIGILEWFPYLNFLRGLLILFIVVFF